MCMLSEHGSLFHSLFRSLCVFLSPSYTQFTQEPHTGRLPLRHSVFTLSRSDDLEMLLERQYALPIANRILDLVYARKLKTKVQAGMVPRQSNVVSV